MVRARSEATATIAYQGADQKPKSPLASLG
jgi:hypothetical protein